MIKFGFKKWLLYLGVASLAGVVCLELVLRFKYGFCDAVLTRADNEFEYIAQPNQDRLRFGNRIFYNAFSQRNENLSSCDSIVIAGFGDSVINGGTQSDQDSLATTKLTRYLSQKMNKPVKVLNISYGSWGPDNCYAYLEKYGDFSAQKFLLLVSSHDAYDNMDFGPTVDVLPAYPSRQYPLAILELIDRYVLPQINKKPESPERLLVINKRKENSVFNTGFQNFLSYSRSHGIPIMVYLHADREERLAGKYNEQGLDILAFCRQNGLPVIKELDYNIPISAYRDLFHLTDAGQDYMYRILKDTLL